MELATTKLTGLCLDVQLETKLGADTGDQFDYSRPSLEMAYSAPSRTIRSGLMGYDMGEALDSRQIEWSISRERKGFILDWRIHLHQTRDD